MFNITQLLLTIDNSIAWNRKLPSILKTFEERTDEHKLATLVGGVWEKINNDFFIKKTLTASLLDKVAKTIKHNEILSLKIQLQAEKFNSQILSYKIKERNKKEMQIYNAAKLGKWSDYYKRVVSDILDAPEEQRLDICKEALLVISNYTTIAMVRTRFTDLRKEIEDQLRGTLKTDILNFFSLPMNLNNYINKEVENSNKERLKSTSRTVLKIKNIKKVIEDYSNNLLYLKDTNPTTLAVRGELISKCLIFLALTTGRRPIELLSIGEFTPVKDKPNYLNFTGQAKIKNEARAEEFNIMIPILFSDYDTVDYIKRLLASLMTRYIKNKNKKEISKFVSPMIDRIWTNFTTTYHLELRNKLSSLRSVYAVTCEKIYNQTKDNQVAQSIYIGNILGHLDYGEDWEHYYDFTLDGRGVDIKKYLKLFRMNNKEK